MFWWGTNTRPRLDAIGSILTYPRLFILSCSRSRNDLTGKKKKISSSPSEEQSEDEMQVRSHISECLWILFIAEFKMLWLSSVYLSPSWDTPVTVIGVSWALSCPFAQYPALCRQRCPSWLWTDTLPRVVAEWVMTALPSLHTECCFPEMIVCLAPFKGNLFSIVCKCFYCFLKTFLEENKMFHPVKKQDMFLKNNEPSQGLTWLCEEQT